jgi:hypothetical protein
MTTGTKSYNDQVTVAIPWHSPNNNCGQGVANCITGKTSKITWSGSDQAPDPIKPNQVYQKVSYNIYDEHGRVKGVRSRNLPFPHVKYSHNLADHSFSKTVVITIDSPEQHIDSCNQQYDYTWYADSSGRPQYAGNNVNPWTSNEDIALLGKLGSKLGAEFDLTIFLGEGKEALETIAHTATRIYLSMKKLKKGNLPGALKVLYQNSGSSHKAPPRPSNRKDAAGRYLEWTYAVQPLLEDVSNAAQHLAYMQNRPMTQVYRASKTVNTPNQVQSFLPTVRCPVNWKIRKSIIARVTSVNEAKLVGLSDPAAVLWEILPYSFVADWFIPIGNYLHALNITSSLSGVFITSSKDEKWTYGFYSKTTGAIINSTFYRYNMTFIRSVGSSLTRPQLPTLKPLSKAASFRHALNATALLVSKFSGQ